MRIIVTLSCLYLLMLSACKTGQEPETHYTNEELLPVMMDLYVASAAIKDLEGTLKDSLSYIYRAQISQIHQVNLSWVESDIALLQQYPHLYEKLHTAVSDTIVALENKNKKKPQPKPKAQPKKTKK